MSVVAAALSVELLALITLHIISFCNGNSYVACTDSERQALLKFKQDLIDPSNRLASWIGDGDCCAWAGVVCNNVTGHVLGLHLGNPPYAEIRLRLRGKINPSLLLLKHLNYLDLSNNEFQGIQIPPFLGSMKNLKYLNLGQNLFEGIIPHQIGNLSNLYHLDLGMNPLLHVHNLFWLSGLHLLEHLDLSFLNLSKDSDSLLVLNALPSLKTLLLTDCALYQFPPLSIVNFSSLAILDLSFNQFDSSLLSGCVFGLSRLVALLLDDNNFQGPIPIGLQNLTSLRVLGLSENNFSSSIPNWLYKFSHLEYLDLGKNSLQGILSDTLANMTSIKDLDLSYNRFEGVIPRSLGRLCNLRSIYVSGLKLSQQLSELLNIFSSQCASNVLEILDFSNNQLSGSLTNQFLRFSHLDSVYLNDNFLSGPVPLFLGQLSSLRILDLSNNKLNGTLVQLHFANLSRLLLFYTSGNSLKLEINPNWIPPFQLENLGLRSCHLGPQFPSWIKSQKHLKNLDLSYSGISDVIPSWFWKYFSQFHYLNLSHNQIQGKIPNLIKATQLQSLDLSWNNFSGPLPLISTSLHVLDLSNNGFSGSLHHFLGCGTNDQKLLQFLKIGGNFLSGQLPDCWMNWSFLIVLDLSNNKFVGSLPISMGTLDSLQSLHLRKNNFSGTIPLSLQRCVELVLFDVAENKFSGNVPNWIGERYSQLRFLILRPNKFHGLLPMELCRLTSLQILDLSSNDLFGTYTKMHQQLHCHGNGEPL